MKKKSLVIISSILLVGAITFAACSEGNEDLSIVDNSPMGVSALSKMYSPNSSGKSGRDVALEDPRDCCGGVLMAHIDDENLSFPVITDSFNELYDFRDNVLSKGEGTVGEIYVDAYYELSTMIKNEEVTLDELIKVSSLLPDIFEVYEKMNDPNHTGVIINDNLKAEITGLLNTYKLKRTDDNRYQNLIAAISQDVETSSNRDKPQIDGFLSQEIQ